MKIKWNKYTWYSRLLALIFFIAIMPVWTFYIGEQYGETIAEIKAAPIVVSMKSRPSIAPLISPIGAPVISSTNIIITNENNGSVMTVHKGDTFLLRLGDLDWTLSFSSPNVVNRVKNIAAIKGSQGIFSADKVGTTVLTGLGRPHCEVGEMCAMFLVSFKMTIKVVQ